MNLAVAGVHLGEPIGRQALLKLGAGGESPLPRHPGPAGRPPLLRRPSRPAPPVRCRPPEVPSVDFGYRGEPRHGRRGRTPVPQGHWYLIGFDRDRGEARTFRVDRIDGVPELGRAGFGPAARAISTSTGPSPGTRGSSATGEEVEVDVRGRRGGGRSGGGRAGRGGGGRAGRRRRRGGPPVGDRHRGADPLGARPARPRRGASARPEPCRGRGRWPASSRRRIRRPRRGR